MQGLLTSTALASLRVTHSHTRTYTMLGQYARAAMHVLNLIFGCVVAAATGVTYSNFNNYVRWPRRIARRRHLPSIRRFAGAH
jgi:hypothetical protein